VHHKQQSELRTREQGITPCFADLYDAHMSFVWRNLRRLGVPESALDDALQDVFLVVHRRLAEFEHRSALRTWLFAILRRVASEYRRKTERTNCHEELDPEQRDSATGSPYEALARTQAVEQLCEVLDKLEESRREVFVLVELEQMPGPDAAEALGLNLNTMYTRLRSARLEFEREAARLRTLNESGRANART
tara:strand:- start:137569 stop:138147 length:579 start_codon:yes stop_codon:yes gene_type:complete